MSQQKNFYTNAAFCQQSEFYNARCKSPNTSTRRQSPLGAQTVHILDTSIRSNAPNEEEHYDEEQEFYEEMVVDDCGTIQEKKFVIVHNDSRRQELAKTHRYEYIPMQQPQPQPQKVLYHEEVDASTGRLHRYATIPSDDELDEIDKQEEERNKRYALVPVEEVQNKNRYAVVSQNTGGRYEYIGSISSDNQTQIQPSNAQHQAFSPRRPPPNPVATQKLHELLTTPKKRVQTPNGINSNRKHIAALTASSPLSPISPIQPKPKLQRTPSRPPGSTPRAQQQLNYALGTRQLHQEKRHTAIVAPICSSPVQSVYSETTFSNKTESSMNMSLKKTTTQSSIAIAAFMMILCGCVTTGLCIYMISHMGRNYYLDFGILSGFICFLLGLLGFRSRHVYWLPNRNYLSGYFVLSVFSLLTCVSLLVLLFMQPKPGTLLADMTSGAVCGISGLSLLLATIGVLASYCCNVPPPDNRVEHCAPGFNV